MSLPFKVGDHGPEITAWQEWFARMYRSYAPPVDGYYGNDETAAVQELQRRLGLPATGVFDEETARRSRYITAPAPATSPRTRFPAFVFRGTGGIIGQDYVSLVCQAVSDLVEEINPNWPATMGGIPVGAAGGLGDPSMQRAVTIAVDDAKRIFTERLKANPRVKVVVGGYSAGAVAAAKFRQWLHDNHPDNYLCSFSIGDPTRPEGGAYYLGAPAPGRGISSWRYGDITDWRHCWLVAPGDMYGSVPVGAVGDIMDTAYDMVTQVELSDPLATARAIITNIPIIMEEAGVGLPAIFGALTGGLAGMAGFWLDVLINSLRGLIVGGGDPAKLTGLAAAAQAAIIAIGFVTAQPPTGPHIEYQFREVWPGATYIDLAVQHVREYCANAAAVAA